MRVVAVAAGEQSTSDGGEGIGPVDSANANAMQTVFLKLKRLMTGGRSRNR